MKETLCACGKPLHYSSPFVQAYIEQMIEDLGPSIRVSLDDGRTWLVPRHYLALHGIVASELPKLAKRLRFREIKGKKR